MEKIKNIVKSIKKNIFFIILLPVLLFLTSYCISNQVHLYTNEYHCSFTSTEQVTEKVLLNKENLNRVKNSADKYKNIDVEQMIKNNDISLSMSNNTYTIITKAKYYDDFFISSSSSKSTRAKKFLQDLIETSYQNAQIEYTNPKIIISSKKDLSLTISLICLGVGFLISIPLSTIMKPKGDDFYDNTLIFKTPFHKDFWKDSTKFLSSVKNITIISMLFALLLLSKFIPIPSGFSSLVNTFGFIFFAIISLIYGPFAGLLIGALSDIIGHFLVNSGQVFFFGYTIQAALSGFIYGLFLYRTKLTFFRILLTRICIGLICNVLIGSICWGIMYKYTYEQISIYMLIISLPKNLVYLVPQSLILYGVIKTIIPGIKHFKLIPEKISKNITIC